MTLSSGDVSSAISAGSSLKETRLCFGLDTGCLTLLSRKGIFKGYTQHYHSVKFFDSISIACKRQLLSASKDSSDKFLLLQTPAALPSLSYWLPAYS